MKKLSLVITSFFLLSNLTMVACSDDDASGTAGGTAGTAGTAGSNTSGSAGSNTSGSAGNNAGGSAGNNAGGSAGNNAGGSSGSNAGGSAGTGTVMPTPTCELPLASRGTCTTKFGGQDACIEYYDPSLPLDQLEQGCSQQSGTYAKDATCPKENRVFCGDSVSNSNYQIFIYNLDAAMQKQVEDQCKSKGTMFCQ
jgi:hypothetical protein